MLRLRLCTFVGLVGEVKLDRRGGVLFTLGPSWRTSTDVSSPGSTGGPEVVRRAGAVKGRPRTGCCNGSEGSREKGVNKKTQDSKGLSRRICTYLADPLD